MLAARGDPTLVKEFEDQLKARWNISQSEPLSSFLGINIYYDRAKGILTFDVCQNSQISLNFRSALRYRRYSRGGLGGTR